MQSHNPDILAEVNSNFTTAEQQTGDRQNQTTLSDRSLDIMKGSNQRRDQPGTTTLAPSDTSGEMERLGFTGPGTLLAMADGTAEKKQIGAGGGVARDERFTVHLGGIANMSRPSGFNLMDQRTVDQQYVPEGSDNRFKVLQSQDRNKQDAKLAVAKFAYFDQPAESVTRFNNFLNGVPRDQLGKPITLTDAQMDAVYSILPNGLDPRQQDNFTFSVEEIGGRRVLVAENTVQALENNATAEKKKFTVYANPNATNHTMDVISFEANSARRAGGGQSNYDALRPEALRAIRSINWER